MRLAIIASAAPSQGAMPSPGERDALLWRDRLELPDLDFEVRVTDPEIDLAQQLGEILEGRGEELEAVVLYASCLVAVADDDECFVCLDPSDPDVGDSLRDLAAELYESGIEPTLVVIDARYHSDAGLDDTQMAKDIAQAVVDSVASGETGVELMVAARPTGAHDERIPSRLTAGLLEAIDSAAGPMTAADAFLHAVQHTDFGPWPNAPLHVAGASAFFLRPEPAAPEQPARTESPEPSTKPAPAEEQHAPEAEESEDVAEEPAPISTDRFPDRRPAPPSERAEAATVSLSERRAALPDRDPTKLPKVIISDPGLPEPPPKAEPPPAPKHRRRSRRASLGVQQPSASAQSADGAAGREAPVAAPEEASVEPEAAQAPAALAPPEEEDVALDEAEAPEQPEQEEEDAAVDEPEAPADQAEDAVDEPEPPPDAEVSIEAMPASGSVAEEVTAAAAVAAREGDATERDGDGPAPPAELEATPPSEPEPQQPPRKPPGEMTAEEWATDGNLAIERGALDEALGFYKKALGKLGTEATPLRAEIYVRMAEVMRGKGKSRVAISNYDKALAIDPQDVRALRGSIELNAEQNNWRQVRTGEKRLLPLLASPDREYEQLMLSGARWLDEAKDVAQAKARFEAARDTMPERSEPLRWLLEIYRTEEDEERILQTRKRLLELADSLEEKADGYTELGEWCLFEVHRLDDAYWAFERALECMPSRLEVLEVLASALAEQQEWAELERMYRKEIELLEGADIQPPPTQVVAEIYRRLCLLYRDHVEDPESALAAMDEALRRTPGNLSGQLVAAELAEELGDSARAVGYLGRAARLEPRRSETYHQLFDLAVRVGDVDAAYLAASVTTLAGSSTDDERIVFHKHRPEPVPAHQRALEPSALELLRDPEADARVEAIMGALAPPILRMRVAQLDKEGKLPELPDRARQDPESSTISVVRSIGWASALLAIPAPAVFVSEEFSGTLMAPFADQQSMLAGTAALRGRTPGDLAFIVGRHLALRLPEHELVAHLRSIEELTACFLAALDIVLGTPPAAGEIGAAARALAKVLPRHQDDEDAEALEEAVRHFEKSGGRVSLTEWLACVERFATRVGYALCGDLEVAAKIIRDDAEPSLLDGSQRIEDLCAFAVSDEHLRVRELLGCSLAPEEEDEDEAD